MQVMVIETKRDELVDTRYSPTVMGAADRLMHWETIEVTAEDYGYYESVRVELENVIEKLKEKGRH